MLSCLHKEKLKMNIEKRNKKDERISVGFRLYPGEAKQLRIALAKAEKSQQDILREFCLNFIKINS